MAGLLRNLLVVLCVMELGEQVSERPEETIEQSSREDKGFTRQKRGARQSGGLGDRGCQGEGM